VRAVGPTLVDWGVGGTLPDPKLTLNHLGATGWEVVTVNDNWGDAPNASAIAAAAARTGAFALAPAVPDAAALLDLAPGLYSVVNSDTANRTGVAMVELYDADEAAGGTQLVNISNRGFVGTGADVMNPRLSSSRARGCRAPSSCAAVGPALSAWD